MNSGLPAPVARMGTMGVPWGPQGRPGGTQGEPWRGRLGPMRAPVASGLGDLILSFSHGSWGRPSRGKGKNGAKGDAKSDSKG